MSVTGLEYSHKIQLWKARILLMVPPQEEFLDLYFLPCSRMELLESPTQLKYLLAIEPQQEFPMTHKKIWCLLPSGATESLL